MEYGTDIFDELLCCGDSFDGFDGEDLEDKPDDGGSH